ncbi:MAG: hypothetical protein WCT26_01190 [Candidatus Buchananbacteria bacterium]
MKMKLIAAMLLALIVVSIAGCPPSPPPYYGTTLYVNNYSSDEIVAVYISPSSSNYWGNNQLAYTIPSGTYASVSGISPGYYDLKAVGYWGGSWIEFGVYISGSTYDWNLLAKKSNEPGSSFGLIDGAPELLALDPVEFNATEGGDLK